MASKLDPRAKIVVKGNFDQKAQNEGCFIFFLRTKWRISHVINF